MNPVRAGATASPDRYPFSTMNSSGWTMGKTNSLLAEAPSNRNDLTKWMLELRASDDEDRIRLGLRRRIFKMPKNKNGYLF
jgi:hypothetical protein